MEENGERSWALFAGCDRPPLVIRSLAMRDLLDSATTIAMRLMVALIEGETGTGRTLVSRIAIDLLEIELG